MKIEFFNPAAMKAARLAAGLTQRQLGDAVGVSPPTVWYWESGRRSPEATRLDEIAAVLGIQRHDLLHPAQAGVTLSELRIRAGLSQALLAAYVELPPSTLASIEVGQAKLRSNVVEAWSRALNVDVDTLHHAWKLSRRRTLGRTSG